MVLLNICCHFRDLHGVIDPSAQSSKDVLTISISLLAFIIALYTLWRTHLKPYRLTICPPTILQGNDTQPSLVLTLSFHNSGAESALINNLRIRTFNNNTVQELVLMVQIELTQFQAGILPLDKKNIAWFSPFIVKGKESEVKRLYFCPMEEPKFSYLEIINTNRIEIDISIWGKWLNNIFSFSYNEFKNKFRVDGAVFIPEHGFNPIYFHGTEPMTTITKRFYNKFSVIKK